MEKFVYLFKEGNKSMRNLLGGKGANLAEMTRLNLPVPSGFTITTQACNNYYQDNKILSDEVIEQIKTKLSELEQITGKKINDLENPLLLSVRSGARESMPGMMDSILNLGLNDEIVEVLAKITNNSFFAYDSYRRLIMMYSDVVKGYPRDEFENSLEKVKQQVGVELDSQLSGEDMKTVVNEFKQIYKKYAGCDFEQDPILQLIEAVKAVFNSWNNDRAIVYRKMHSIPNSWGTAVNVEEMVYGNMGDTSGTGVAFSRNPVTGKDELYGEYLINAQGEDVVAGIRTPFDISKLKEDMPDIYEEFYNCAKTLEKHYKDMQDMEFTIENKKLYILQTRNGKRTAKSAIKIAVDMVSEGLITKEEAILRVEPETLEQLLHKTFDEKEVINAKLIATGLAASPGAAVGKIYFNARDVILAKEKDEDAILVRSETSAEDIEGMNAAMGVLTIRGGKTSHAAVVARGMGKCCVSSASNVVINEELKTITFKDNIILKEGDYISLDGTEGRVYLGKITLTDAIMSDEVKTFMSYVDEVRNLGIRANADTPNDVKKALEFGAEGIGLCRSEHMFFEEKRILAIREMIIASNKKDRQKALDKLKIFQKEDYYAMLEAVNGRPMTIRLLDPPLHEFLPKTKEEVNTLATTLNLSTDIVNSRIDALKEFNPMMGHRGCRLSITYPEIAIMQTQAIIEAAIDVINKNIDVKVEIMIPLISDVKELEYVKNIVDETARKIIKENNIEVDYKIGTMIEVPRACVISHDIAKQVEFFSYGTNDLTQLTYGFSRDDSEKFLTDYYKNSIFDENPFETIDKTGVGKLMEISVALAKKVKPNIKLGICGEHGGETKSISFCQKLGLDYVSCSTYRVPIARLAAAKAAIKFGTQK